MYKKRKETTHGEIGEEDTHYKYTHTHTHTHTHTYILKISTMYVNKVTRPVYKQLKEALKTTRR